MAATRRTDAEKRQLCRRAGRCRKGSAVHTEPSERQVPTGSPGLRPAEGCGPPALQAGDRAGQAGGKPAVTEGGGGRRGGNVPTLLQMFAQDRATQRPKGRGGPASPAREASAQPCPGRGESPGNGWGFWHVCSLWGPKGSVPSLCSGPDPPPPPRHHHTPSVSGVGVGPEVSQLDPRQKSPCPVQTCQEPLHFSRLPRAPGPLHRLSSEVAPGPSQVPLDKPLPPGNLRARSLGILVFLAQDS